MSHKILTSATFRRKAKKLLKKYPSLREELLQLNAQLVDNPELGTAIGNNCFKIRLAVKSKGKGKSGGLRVITHHIVVHLKEREIWLATIYDKSEYSNISDAGLLELIEEIEQGRRP